MASVAVWLVPVPGSAAEVAIPMWVTDTAPPVSSIVSRAAFLTTSLKGMAQPSRLGTTRGVARVPCGRLNGMARKATPFFDLVAKTPTCWLWTGGLSTHGYGVRWYGGRVQGAHRVAYQMLVGPISDGMPLDHLCHNRDRPATERINTAALTAPESCVSTPARRVTHTHRKTRTYRRAGQTLDIARRASEQDRGADPSTARPRVRGPGRHEQCGRMRKCG